MGYLAENAVFMPLTKQIHILMDTVKVSNWKKLY